MSIHETVNTQTICFHCGDSLGKSPILFQNKTFCCNGCKNVYSLLNKNNLEEYYCLNEAPGVTIKETNTSKFQYLDDLQISKKLISFSTPDQTQVILHLPQIHCSSCLWLLENLRKLNEYILSSKVNFSNKQITIFFNPKGISLREVAELLSSIGYEPHISLSDVEEEKTKINHTKAAYKLGITGFCFANIMLISFPEYLGLEFEQDETLSSFFRYVNFGLSLPVLLYGAQEFFVNAYYSIKQRYLNIDAPIALAILVTFIRSVYEVFTQTGAGYFDSMSGIVFFMLVGRTLQNKTSQNLKFNRDYQSYFPVAVSTLQDTKEISKKIQDIVIDDILIIHHQEIIPVDCILSKGRAEIDYSFVTGENLPTTISVGEIIYAGGKLIGTNIEVIAIKPFSQNSFTQLWNNSAFNSQNKPLYSFVTKLSKYFSYIVFLFAIGGFTYWSFDNMGNAWNAMTAVLIVACPCALLLCSSFTFGYIIEMFSKHGFFVKSAETIERLTKINHVVFDKTGTITETNDISVQYTGKPIESEKQQLILSLMAQSIHPLSKAIVKYYKHNQNIPIEHYKEVQGAGIEAWFQEKHIKVGSAKFTGVSSDKKENESEVYISIDQEVLGKYTIKNKIKDGIPSLIKNLSPIQVSLLSGDSHLAETQMRKIFKQDSELLFQQSPQDKLDYIEKLQKNGKRVLMIGDGLNDAGALKQSDVGISVVENTFSFSPACDAIIDSHKVSQLNQYILMSKASKKLIQFIFTYSILYNLIGIYFALTVQLMPVVAAVLMPSSSISIIIISYLGTKYIEKKYGINQEKLSPEHLSHKML